MFTLQEALVPIEYTIYLYVKQYQYTTLTIFRWKSNIINNLENKPFYNINVMRNKNCTFIFSD